MADNYTCPQCDEGRLWRMDLVQADVPTKDGASAISMDFKCDDCGWDCKLLTYQPDVYTGQMIQQAVESVVRTSEWSEDYCGVVQTKFWTHEHLDVLDRLATET